jgi:hypothetical protein
MRVLRLGRPVSFVTRGRVYCPYSRSDVDVDQCYDCPSCEGLFDNVAGGTWVRCGAPYARL